MRAVRGLRGVTGDADGARVTSEVSGPVSPWATSLTDPDPSRASIPERHAAPGAAPAATQADGGVRPGSWPSCYDCCGDLTTAPLLPGRLRSADAIHLATALRLNARAMVVYDTELHAVSRTAGIDAVSPGAG